MCSTSSHTVLLSPPSIMAQASRLTLSAAYSPSSHSLISGGHSGAHRPYRPCLFCINNFTCFPQPLSSKSQYSLDKSQSGCYVLLPCQPHQHPHLSTPLHIPPGAFLFDTALAWKVPFSTPHLLQALNPAHAPRFPL